MMTKQASDFPEFTLYDLGCAIWRRRFLFVAIVAFFIAVAAFMGSSAAPSYETSGAIEIGKFDGAVLEDPKELVAHIRRRHDGSVGSGPRLSTVDTDLNTVRVAAKGGVSVPLAEYVNNILNEVVERHAAILENSRAPVANARASLGKQADRLLGFLDQGSTGGELTSERGLLLNLGRQSLAEQLFNVEREALNLDLRLIGARTKPTMILRRPEANPRNFTLPLSAYLFAGTLIGLFTAVLVTSGWDILRRARVARS